MEQPSAKTHRIRELNDRLRKAAGPGTTCVTRGVMAGGEDFMSRVLALVARFDAFTEDNDPYGEHDFGDLEVDGRRLFWKIDYYDPNLSAGSEDPSDESGTHRVMTVMLADEY